MLATISKYSKAAILTLSSTKSYLSSKKKEGKKFWTKVTMLEQ